MESDGLKSLRDEFLNKEKEQLKIEEEKLKEVHRLFLLNEKPIYLNFHGIFFTEEEKNYLNKWNHWMMGLVKEELPPLNVKQRRFVEIYKTKISVINEPPKEFEKWYVELINEQKSFVRYYFVDKFKDGIKSYLNRDKSDSIYYMSKVVLTFGNEKYLNKRFEGTHYEKVVKRKNV